MTDFVPLFNSSQWWADQKKKYDLVTSQLVIDEAAAGDPTAAQERLGLLTDLPLLDIQHPDVKILADDLIANHLLPEKALADARHVAVSAVFGVDYLLTWNCKHIANAETLPRIYTMLRNSGFEPPLVVTPEEFSGNVLQPYTC
jgi:hypothetical protein